MTVSKWSTTAGDNATADPTINWAENQNPSTVNNSARAEMAAIRSWYEDVEFRDWGHTVTRTGNTTFTIATDVTSIYTADRPIRCADSSTLYGFVASSSYSAPNTTVTVTLDSGNLSASLTAVALGISPSTQSIPIQAIRNGASGLLAGANDWTGNQTHAGTETFNSTATFNSTTAFNTNPTVTSTDAGATAGPIITLDRNSASPANSDLLGAIDFKGRDDGGGTDTFARIVVQIDDISAGSEDASIILQRVIAGSLTTAMTISATSVNIPSGMTYNINGVANGSTRVLLDTQNASSSSEIKWGSSYITSTYKKYEIDILEAIPSGDGGILEIQVYTDGGTTPDSSGKYDNSLTIKRHNTSSEDFTTNDNGTYFRITGGSGIDTAAGGSYCGTVCLANHANSNLWTKIWLKDACYSDNSSGEEAFAYGSCRWQDTTVVNGIRIFPESGNIASGIFKLYGIL